jgi:hypothetical protein
MERKVEPWTAAGLANGAAVPVLVGKAQRSRPKPRQTSSLRRLEAYFQIPDAENRENAEFATSATTPPLIPLTSGR